jgi:hypothetical protein
MINAILSTIILVGIVIDGLYIHRLEKEIDALKEWIKFFYHVDLDKVTEFVENERDGDEAD